MLNRRNFISSLSLAGAAIACGAEPGPAVGGGDTGHEDPLRTLSDGLLPIGVAISRPHSGRYTREDLALIGRHFSILTPENEMKWPKCQPAEARHAFGPADEIVAFAQAHRQKVVGHTLLFNRAGDYPAWLFRDGDGDASPAMVEKRMRRHFETILGRYRERVYAWDVVNEAVEDRPPYYRETDWYSMFGKEFVPMAFCIARELAPDAALIYNDYAVEQPRKRDRVLLLIEELKQAGVAPDIVGIQGHWELDRIPFDEIEETILSLHQAGVRVSITELDLDVMSRAAYWNTNTRAEAVKQNPYPDACPDDVLQRQAEQYGQLFELLLKHADKMERVTFWGLTDGHSWLNSWPWKRTAHALLFDRNARPKPAFHAVAKALQAARRQASLAPSGGMKSLSRGGGH
jgi:endo-1,4-beta-xylanase